MMGSPLPWRPLLLLVALTLTCKAAKSKSKKPNIIMIVVDDLGHRDVSITDPKMVSPCIKKIREEGLYLSQCYTAPSCGPSRAAILSGRYPHTWGGHLSVAVGETSSFYPKEKLLYLGDVMRSHGYATHALGKWHQGLCHPSLRPLGRGFDTFYGMLTAGSSSQYDRMKKNGLYDWWDNEKQDFSGNGTHSTILLSKRMVKIINGSSAMKPFFAYLAYQAVHKPFQADQKYFSNCSHIENYERRRQCAMVSMVDEGVCQIVEALKTKGVYDNTAIIFMSDNGGTAGDTSGSSDWPLRGRKGSLHEGGTNVFTVLKAPELSVTNATWSGLIQSVDWMTICNAMARGKKEKWMHGKNLWPDIKAFRESRRKEVFYHIDDREHTKKGPSKAYRYGKWKVIQGFTGFSFWYPPSNNGSQYTEPILPTKEQKRKLTPDDFQLFNLAEDPNEKNDLALDEDHKKDLNKVKRKMQRFLRKYTIYNHTEIEKGRLLNLKTGKLVSCFCHPPWADSTTDCPSPSS